MSLSRKYSRFFKNPVCHALRFMGVFSPLICNVIINIVRFKSTYNLANCFLFVLHSFVSPFLPSFEWSDLTGSLAVILFVLFSRVCSRDPVCTLHLLVYFEIILYYFMYNVKIFQRIIPFSSIFCAIVAYNLQVLMS